MTFTRVYLVLPYENTADGFAFARQCALASFARGEAPINLSFAYASVLDFESSQEREMIDVSAATWIAVATKLVCYTDLGVSKEMKDVLSFGKMLKLPIDFRRLIGGRPGAEALHFQEIPHNEVDCALCLGPQRVAQLRSEGLTSDELAEWSQKPKPKEE